MTFSMTRATRRARWASMALATGLLVQSVPLQGQNPGGGGGTTGGTPGGSPGGTNPGTPGGGTGNPGGVPGGTPGRPGDFPTGRDPGINQQRFPDMGQRPIFISGKVMMEDGQPPNEQVTIERVCNGTPVPEGYADSKGRFSFQLGQRMGVMADASVSSASDTFGGGGFGGGGGMPNVGGGGRGMSEMALNGCEIRAALPGHRSTVVSLAGRRVMDNPDIGTILLRRLGKVEGLTVSMTSALAPKDARKAFEKGQGLAKKGKFDEAKVNIEKAVELYPKYAMAWHTLGMLRERASDVPGAKEAYAKALEADNRLIPPYLNLASMAAKEAQWKEVTEASERVLKLNPYDYTQAYLLHAVAQLNLQQWDAAEKSAREGIKTDLDHRMPQLEHVLGLALANKQDYTGAAEHMRSFLKQAPNAGSADTVRKQLAEVEKALGTGAVSQKQPN